MERRSKPLRQFKLHPPILIDTDCVSSFLWVKSGELIPKILNQTIFIPQEVIREIDELRKYEKCRWVPEQVDLLLESGQYSRLLYA